MADRGEKIVIMFISGTASADPDVRIYGSICAGRDPGN